MPVVPGEQGTPQFSGHGTGHILVSECLLVCHRSPSYSQRPCNRNQPPDNFTPMADKQTTKVWRKAPRAIAAVLPKVAEPALRKRGFSAVEIITNWSEIVGPELAQDTSPDRLAFPRGARNQGTLHVTAPGAVALEIQHLEPIIVERINTYFGYGAVNRIALTQGAVHKKPKSKIRTPEKPRPVNPARQAEIETRTQDIESDVLRDALRELGQSVAAAQAKRHEKT